MIFFSFLANDKYKFLIFIPIEKYQLYIFYNDDWNIISERMSIYVCVSVIFASFRVRSGPKDKAELNKQPPPPPTEEAAFFSLELNAIWLT